ncbi:CU044_2847 family protein [Saccharopolyspora taberi]|uniref:Trypsin-co-occurring domain-containing protein n=1 Tax=Saccharopolyspora taberi TaxID=60895 RepID=A0ABN3V6X0_9PSEU
MTLVSMPLDGGGEILIEAADEQHGNARVGRRNGVEQATETVQAAMGATRPAAEAVLGELRSMEQPPARISLQFGIKVTGEANLAVAKSAGEANFTVSVEWSAPKEG